MASYEHFETASRAMREQLANRAVKLGFSVVYPQRMWECPSCRSLCTTESIDLHVEWHESFESWKY